MQQVLTAKAIAFDIDWAPDHMVEDCLEICAAAGVPASFYATHPSGVLDEISQDHRFELGIHPNFLSGSSHGSTYRDVLRYCLDLAPNASSMRTHCLYQNSRMFGEIVTSFPQITVDASLFLPGHHNLQAIDFNVSGSKIRRLPFYWEDDVFAETATAPAWCEPRVTEGLNIFAFHPVHVAVNTDRMDRYNRLKSIAPVNTWTRDFTSAHANDGAGARTFLEALVTSIPKDQFMTISGMADAA